MIKSAMLVLITILVLLSCENPVSETITLKKILPGTWKNNAIDCKITMIFMVSGNDVILDGSVYEGTFTDSTFQGTCNAGNTNSTLDIKMLTEIQISGSNNINDGNENRKLLIDAMKI